MLKFITHKSFVVNLLVIILLVMVLLFGFFSLLGAITKHGETEKVPSVRGLTYDQATAALEKAGFPFEIQDSIYVDSARPLQVIRQSPEADAIVKPHRKVYLTINRAEPPLVEMPDVRGFSLKSAVLFLQTLGLKVGDTSYVFDIAKDAVKDQKYNGKFVAPGTKVGMGTRVDLVIGNGLGSQSMNVPDLVGMTVAEARDYLSSQNIELGAIVPLESVSDTENAYITRQKPMPYSQIAEGVTTPNKIRPGQIMDVWISLNPPAPSTPENSVDLQQ